MFSDPKNFLPSNHISNEAQIVSARHPFHREASNDTFLKISVSILLVLAVLCVIVRTIIRLHKFKKFYVDDYILFLGTGTLISGSVIKLYAIVVGESINPSVPSEKSLEAALSLIWLNTVPQILSSATIYCVKFCFLFYFKGLLRRLPKTTKWWWCVLAILVVVTPPSIFANFMACPVVTAMAMGKWSPANDLVMCADCLQRCVRLHPASNVEN